MKKLLFVLAFAFIGGEAFSQMYTLSVQRSWSAHPSNCPNISTSDKVMIKIDPAGNETYTCIEQVSPIISTSKWIVVQQEINSILNLGYKVIGTPCNFFNESGGTTSNSINDCTWYFAIP